MEEEEEEGISFAFNDTIEGPRSTRLVTVPKKSLRERERERERELY